jgi:hypothetical protein
MKHERDNSFAERRETSLKAKNQLLERIKSAPKPDQAELDRRSAEKAAAAIARETRQGEQQRIKEAAAQHDRAQAEALLQSEAQARLASDAENAQAAVNSAAQEVERKLERDRRYAARKARQR